MSEFLQAAYPVTQLFWYRILFMAELLIAEALFTFRLRRRSYFALRVSGAALMSFGFAFAVPSLHINAAYLSFMFLSMFVFTLAMLKLCYRESFKTLLFCGVAAYTTQHIAYETYNLTYILLNINGGVPVSVYGNGSALEFFRDPIAQLNYFWGHAIVYWAMLVLFGNRIKRGESIELKSIPMFVIVVIVLCVDIVIGSVVTYYNTGEYNRFFMFLLSLYNVAVSLCMLYIQFTHLLVRRLNKELDGEKRLRRIEEEQFKLSRENIELINLKCHDLKHQIRTIGEEKTLDPTVIAEMENAISIYDAMFKTGNGALDTVLTEKNLVCNKKGISLTCCVANKVLAFMADSDLYSLLGNALDNAIEAVSALEPEKRTIDISIKQQGKMQTVNVRNYFDGKVEFDKDLPKSTKGDAEYHGFGILSMKRTVERYGGTLTVNAADGIFTVNILFPTSD